MPLVTHLPFLLIAVALLLPVAEAAAATPGRDDASDQSYAKRPAWTSGENGGSGFLGWNLVGSGEAADARGFRIAQSRSFGADSEGPGELAFSMFANGKDASAEAYRTFDAPLDVGQIFSVDIAVNFRSGIRGLDLRAGACDSERVLFNFNVGMDDYVVNKASTGNGSLGAAYHDHTFFTLSFRQSHPGSGDWTVSRQGGIESESAGTYEGRAAGVKFYVIETDGGKENELWVNNLTISTAPAP